MNRLSIIILSFNTKEFTLACIRSIIQQYKKELEKGEFEIIVVDNASTDGTIESIKSSKSIKDIKSICLIENKENYGFSKGNNIGAKNAKGKYLLFLNSDTEVLDKGLVEMIIFFKKHKDVGILGARLQNSDGSRQPSTGMFYHLGVIFLMLFGGERFGLLRESPLRVKAVDWVSGGAMMVRKDLFDTLRGFDEHFFMYVEDMELCFRAKKIASRTYFSPHVSIEHKTLGSSNRTFAILNIYKGLLYFYRKHRSPVELEIIKFLLKTKALVAILVGTITQNTYLKDTYRKALALSI